LIRDAEERARSVGDQGLVDLQLADHASRETTAVYIHVLSEHLVAEYARLGL
jgi:hypothetical protein